MSEPHHLQLQEDLPYHLVPRPRQHSQLTGPHTQVAACTIEAPQTQQRDLISARGLLPCQEQTTSPVRTSSLTFMRQTLVRHSQLGEPEQGPLSHVPAPLEKLCGGRICQTSCFLAREGNLFRSRATRANPSLRPIGLLCDPTPLVGTCSAGIQEQIVSHKQT